jgi:hypothetical protein
MVCKILSTLTVLIIKLFILRSISDGDNAINIKGIYDGHTTIITKGISDGHTTINIKSMSD